MRTTLNLPDDILRRAKIATVEHGSALRQFVTDTLRYEIEGTASSVHRRKTSPPINLSSDAPSRKLSPDAVKRLNNQSVAEADAARTSGRVGQLAEPVAISLAAASKHIRALEKAGLIHREVQWRTHVCRPDRGRLASAHEWLSFYEHFCTGRLNVLERVLREEGETDAGR